MISAHPAKPEHDRLSQSKPQPNRARRRHTQPQTQHPHRVRTRHKQVKWLERKQLRCHKLTARDATSVTGELCSPIRKRTSLIGMCSSQVTSPLACSTQKADETIPSFSVNSHLIIANLQWQWAGGFASSYPGQSKASESQAAPACGSGTPTRRARWRPPFFRCLRSFCLETTKVSQHALLPHW